MCDDGGVGAAPCRKQAHKGCLARMAPRRLHQRHRLPAVAAGCGQPLPIGQPWAALAGHTGPVFDIGAASSACPYASDCSDCTAYVLSTPTSAGYFPTRCTGEAPPARSVATNGIDGILPLDARRRRRRRLAAATSVASPDRPADNYADSHADRPANRPTARHLLSHAAGGGGQPRRRLLKAGASAHDSHSSAGSLSGGRPATYGAGRWGTAASSVTRRAPVFAGAGAGVHFTGGVSHYGRSVPYYYGRRSVSHNAFLMVLLSSHFHNHNGYHHCGNTPNPNAAVGPDYDGVTYDRFACKQASSYRTPTDLDRYELAEAFALPPIASGSSQWPLELTVHELLLYPSGATEGRAPPALLGFSTNDVSTVDTLRSYVLVCMLLVLLAPLAVLLVGLLCRLIAAAARRLCTICAPSLASKPGSTMM